jgi:2-C-methyl-D-erythritol 2,4-cyclodiphosphate synthase
MNPIRIGYGNDIHRFAPERDLFLCGCKIPCRLGGLLGHSDADAAIHALIDALIGALALGDIGHFFPDTDPAYKGATGEFLLTSTLSHTAFAGWSLGNLDMTIEAQEPKLAPYILPMRENLARIMQTDISRISIKAKTGEGLDAVGRKEAIKASCVVLLIHNQPDNNQ